MFALHRAASPHFTTALQCLQVFGTTKTKKWASVSSLFPQTMCLSCCAFLMHGSALVESRRKRCLSSLWKMCRPWRAQFAKVVLIVVIGGCGLHNWKVFLVRVDAISKHTSCMDSATRTMHSLEVYLLMSSFGEPQTPILFCAGCFLEFEISTFEAYSECPVGSLVATRA